jgi:hypothetical protein
MNSDIGKQLADLQRLTVHELRVRYAEVFREETLANNRAWLVKRLAWRLQAQAEGDLSERARRRAEELARDTDLRLNPPLSQQGPAPEEWTRTKAARFEPDSRLPPPGTILTRNYKGQTLQVQVLPHGFHYDGRVYASLSAVAKAITGSHCNGFLFFKLTPAGD